MPLKTGITAALILSFEQKGTMYHLDVKDNGVGLLPGYGDKESLGLTVIEALSEQLGGTHELS